METRVNSRPLWLEKLNDGLMIVIQVFNLTVNFGEVVGEFVFKVLLIVHFLRIPSDQLKLHSQVSLTKRCILWLFP